MENSHINESILSEEILEDQKKNRIDHMTYLPGMEDIGSDVMDQVISAMNAYDYEKYTEADVRRAIAHEDVYKRQAGLVSFYKTDCSFYQCGSCYAKHDNKRWEKHFVASSCHFQEYAKCYKYQSGKQLVG